MTVIVFYVLASGSYSIWIRSSGDVMIRVMRMFKTEYKIAVVNTTLLFVFRVAFYFCVKWGCVDLCLQLNLTQKSEFHPFSNDQTWIQKTKLKSYIRSTSRV